MPKALLLADDAAISSLYSINLKAYTDIDVVSVTGLKGALEAMTEETFEVAIIYESPNKKNQIESVHNLLKDEKFALLYINLTDTNREKLPSDVLTLDDPFNVKKIIQTVAKLLGITAKQMAQKDVSAYYPIPISVVTSLKTPPCDIYLKEKEEDKYFAIYQKGSSTPMDLVPYQNEGHYYVYVPAGERLKIINNSTEMILKALESNSPPSVKLSAARKGIELILEQVTDSQTVKDEVVEVSEACVNAIKEIVDETSSFRELMGQLLDNQESYVYTHSILSTYVATKVVKSLSWGNPANIQKITYVLFFHDIYLLPLYKNYRHILEEEEFIYDADVSDKDKEIVLNHARMAGELLQQFPQTPMGADNIVTQHHGTKSGQGFPVTHNSDISPLAKVIIVTEDFVYEIFKSLQEGAKFNKKDAILKVGQKYTQKSYLNIVESLYQVEI